MKDLPYFRWFPADAETDESYRSMTDEERGFYHHCLNISWINDGIPADAGDRARVLNRNRNQADARWTPLVATRFVPHQYRLGYLVNTRQEAERVHAKHKSVKATESANIRYERSKSKGANALHARAGADSDSDSEVEYYREIDRNRPLVLELLVEFPGAVGLPGKPDAFILDQCIRLSDGSMERLVGALRQMFLANKRPSISWAWFPKVLEQYLTVKERRA